jgi:hypothetical protein
MHHRIRPLSLAAMLVLPLAVIGMFANGLRAQLNHDQASPLERIDAPTTWVAFQATVVQGSPGESLVHGRYFRSSNGSERLETGPDLKDIRVVSIKNTLRRTAFTMSPRGFWTQMPWQAPHDGLPPQYVQSPNIRLHPFRLAIRKGESGATNADVGFTAYSRTQLSGMTSLIVPELNFFEVVRQRPDGWHQAFREIEQREPDGDLFLPPPDAVVTLDPRAALQ